MRLQNLVPACLLQQITALEANKHDYKVFVEQQQIRNYPPCLYNHTNLSTSWFTWTWWLLSFRRNQRLSCSTRIRSRERVWLWYRNLLLQWPSFMGTWRTLCTNCCYITWYFRFWPQSSRMLRIRRLWFFIYWSPIFKFLGFEKC